MLCKSLLVIISDWGGPTDPTDPTDLTGQVVRVDPFGLTQFSALGVEEQRVNAVIAFASPADDYAGLGHGVRVETRIVVWQAKEIFIVKDGTAQLRTVDIGPNNGIVAQATSGLSEDDRVILYPSSGLTEGMSLAQRVVS
ncbi:MAG: hypothetical protein ACPGVS_03155 [Primorskyibacter sp.]